MQRFLIQKSSNLLHGFECFVDKQIDKLRRKSDDSNQNDDDDDDNSSNRQQQNFSLITNLESQLIELQSLLIWERPCNSILALILFTCFYWTVVIWEPRFISVVASMAFCYHFYEMWCRYVWPEIRAPSEENRESWTSVNPSVLSAPELKEYLERIRLLCLELIDSILQFRKRSHGAFCCFTTILFIIIYYIGRFIPGSFIIYTAVLLLFLTPGFLTHLVPKNTFDDFVSRYITAETGKSTKISILNIDNNSISNNSDNHQSSTSNNGNDDEDEIENQEEEQDEQVNNNLKNKSSLKKFNILEDLELDSTNEFKKKSSSYSTMSALKIPKSIESLFTRDNLITSTTTTNENYFDSSSSRDSTPESQEDSSVATNTDSDFVLISDSEINEI